MLKDKAYPAFLILAGICFVFSVNLNAGIIVASLVTIILHFSKKIDKCTIYSFLFLLLLGISYRFFYFNKLTNNINKPVSFNGIILSHTPKDHYTSSKILVFNLNNYNDNPLAFFKIFEITIPGTSHENIKGKIIKGVGLLKEKTIFKNNGTDNTNFYKARNNLHYISIPSIQNISLSSCVLEKIYSIIDKISLPQNEINSSILKAIISGDKSNIPYHLKETLQKSGIYHLFVVSGFHFGIFFSFIYFILILIPIRKKTKTFISLTILLILLIINSFAPSTLRAFSMLFIYFLFNSFDIEISPTDAVGVAGIFMLLYNIYAPHDPGFLLSFLVTGGILASINNKEILLSATFKIPMVAFLTSAPIIIFIFHKTNFLSPLLNILATPLVSISIYSYLISIFQIPLTCDLTNQLITLLITLSEVGAKFSTEIYVPYFAGLISLIAVGIYTSTKITLKKTAIYSTFIISLFLISIKLPLDSSFLLIPDTGQSQCIIIKLKNKTILIDSATEHGATTAIIPILKMNKIKIIDHFFISHFDSDHGGGILEILKSFKVNNIYFPYYDKTSSNFCKAYSYIKEKNVLLNTAKKGEIITIDNKTVVKVLNPETNQLITSTNATSMALEINTNNNKISIPGDLDGNNLLKISSEFTKTDILIAPHHGSKKAALKYFANKTNPKLVVVCCGKYNRFNFPSKSFLNLYKNSKIWITGKSGEFYLKLKSENK